MSVELAGWMLVTKPKSSHQHSICFRLIGMNIVSRPPSHGSPRQEQLTFAYISLLTGGAIHTVIRAINSVSQACSRAKIGTDSFGNARSFSWRAEVQFEGMETAGEREERERRIERERETDRQTDRDRETVKLR